jgi:hypothetical protein
MGKHRARSEKKGACRSRERRAANRSGEKFRDERSRGGGAYKEETGGLAHKRGLRLLAIRGRE